MQYHKLGATDITVSKICFGALGIGPLQANLPLDEGAEVIRYAFEQGINFIDTAELYNTYAYICKALKSYHKDVVIASKSYAYTAQMMKESFERARQELDRDYIDIFLLHEQESIHTIRGHWEAFEYLLELKSKKLIKAVGISTHNIAAVQAAQQIPEVDVIHPLLNYKGLGINDGGREEMEKAVLDALALGKGIYLMKALGGGNFISDPQTALNYAFHLPTHSVAIGMKSIAEVNYNIEYLEKGCISEATKSQVNSQPRKLFIEKWCEQCGKCVERCSQNALTVKENAVEVNTDACILCGYCASACREFCIKIV